MAKRTWRGIVYDEMESGRKVIVHVVEIEADDDVGKARQRLLRMTKGIRSENGSRTLVVERLQTRAEELGMTNAPTTLELLKNLVAGLDETNWSSWQSTARFQAALDAARAQVLKYDWNPNDDAT